MTLDPNVVAAFVERCRAERLAAGGTAHLEDRAVAELIANTVLDHRREQAGKTDRTRTTKTRKNATRTAPSEDGPRSASAVPGSSGNRGQR